MKNYTPKINEYQRDYTCEECGAMGCVERYWCSSQEFYELCDKCIDKIELERTKGKKDQTLKRSQS